jgi:uncharacterized protein YodC (DUF2158 family)
MYEIRIGDVVSHCEGGAIMTVEEVGLDNRVGCVWFDKGRLHRELFDIHSLNRWVRKEF